MSSLSSKSLSHLVFGQQAKTIDVFALSYWLMVSKFALLSSFLLFFGSWFPKGRESFIGF
jgi:hypothetical protein